MSFQAGRTRQTMASNSEGREATRTILEDVCSDFETMNVVATKSNKVGVIKNFRTRSSAQLSSDGKYSRINPLTVKNSPFNRSVEKKELCEKTSSTLNKEASNKISAASDISSNKSMVNTEINDISSSTATNNVHTNPVHQNKNEFNKTVETSLASGTKYLQSSTNSTDVNIELNQETNSELLPLSSSHETNNVTIMPDNFAMDSNLSALAQLADAEIVQSGDNVSIIVSNPRFIEVLTNTSTPLSSLETGTVIETPTAVLETDIGSTHQIELVDSSLLSNSTLQDVMIADDINLIQERVTSEKHVSSKTCAQVRNFKSPKKEGRGRGRPPKSTVSPRKSAGSPPPSYIPSTPFTRGRRVTARMKAAWTRLLEMDGRLVCQMPGCSQTFVTVANFQTHFKYCSGRKTLQKCDYCESMIFSTHKAILQHMEVEHPEKADEYRAAHREEILEFEKNNAPDHLIISEDENVAMNVEQITQNSSNITRKRKLSEKESTVPNKKVILKHKLQSIQNSMAENAKEFKKCVRFDSITDAINSVKISTLEEACRIETPIRKPDRRLKRVFTEKLVAADKYFEDDDDEDADQPRTEEELQKEKQLLRERMHTKARLMLNLERYKRYQEYLTVTRDWSSERKTYSRSRGSDVSVENPFTSQMLNESFQDIQLLNNMTESSSISLNASEVEINSIQMPSVETYQVVETPEFVSAIAVEPEGVLTSTPNNNSIMSSNHTSSELEAAHLLTYVENRVRREKTACYNRVNFENPKPKPKLGGIITYGLKLPEEDTNKLAEPPVTFDSLVSFMKPNTVQNNSQAEDIENVIKSDKESSAKLLNNKDVATAPKKRGRPPKHKVKSTVDTKVTKASHKTIKMQKGRAKKYSAAMLKSIERNVNNKKIRLFGIKTKLKSKRYASKKINLKNIRLKQSKSNLINKKIDAKKKRHSKAKLVDVAAIQCQENIDNHLPIGQGINISDITCLSSENNYTNTLNQMIVDANIAGEIEIASSITEQVSEIDVDKSVTLSENLSNENVVSQQVDKESERGDASDLPLINSEVSDEHASLNKIEDGQITDEGKVNEEASAENVNDKRKEISTESIILVQNSNDESLNLMQKDTENNDTCVELQKQIESDKSELSFVQDNQIETVSSDKQVLSNLENSVTEQLNIDNAPLDDVNANNIEKPTEQLNIDSAPLDDVNANNIEKPTEQLNIDSAPLDDVNANNIEKPTEINEVPQSDTNEKVEDSQREVPVKRGRGRPRKNSKKIVPNDKLIQQSTLEDHELDKSKIIEDNDKICKEVKGGNTSENPVVDNLISNDKKTITPVRKSERVRRRKLVNDEIIQPSIAETKQREVPPSTPVTRSGHRGRPRKHAIKETPLEISDNKVEHAEQKTSEIESEAVDESLRKFSRKGRPRKCVRYADLNSGLESSESMDGIHGVSVGKVKSSDSAKEKKVKNVKKTQSSNEVTELPSDSTAQEDIILPLKKRKQRQTKKKDSDIEKSKLNKAVVDDILLSEEESQDQLEENDASDKRKLKNRKRGTKRKKSGVDTSDEEWDPEVHLKSIGKSPGRKDILELEETSDSSCSERRDHTFSKKDGDAIHRISSSYIKTERLDVAAAKYSLKTSEELFMEYKPQKWMWEILIGDSCILPPMKTSPYFKIEKMWGKSEAYWNSLKLFDSVPLDKDSCHGTFFTGGPVTCSAWCPTPAEGNKVQYVAVAVSSLINKVHSYLTDELERGFLQLWNVGDLNEKMLQVRPFMEMSIFHEYGPINDMTWCPYGCWENPQAENSTDFLPRLGLLAIACSDSNIRIYSIPHPHLLPKEGTGFPIYTAHPSIILESLCSNICLATKKSSCVSLTWQKSDHCERIAAGYGCGMICVWHVNSSATILVAKENSQIILKPYLVFNGHGTPVLGLSFSPLPGGRFLVSSSIDKTLKFWDLIDTSLPVYTVKKGAGKCAHWSSYYCGAFGSIQHGMNNFKGSTFFKECGTETISSRALSHPNCCIILSSLSDWLNALAIGDITGNVSVSFTHSLIHEHAKGPQYFQRYVYESKLEPVEGIVDKIIFSSYPESMNCIEKIKEIKEISLLLDDAVSLVCEATDILENFKQKSIEECTDKSCQIVVNELKEVVSIVHHIIEDSSKNAVVDIQDFTEAISADDSEMEYNVDEQEEKQLCKLIPSKISGITDVVTLVTDIHDVTEAVEDLISSSQVRVSQSLLSSSAEVISPDTSSMEIDDSEDLNEIDEHSHGSIHSSLDIIQLLDFLLDTVDQNEVSHKIKELSNEPVQVSNDRVVADINSDGIACISTVDEMSNLVSVVESMTESCCKIDISNVSLQNESTVAVKPEDNACTSTVDEMANVVIIMENLAENCSMPQQASRRNKENKKFIYNGIGLPHDFSEMVDVVSAVSDIQDTTDTVTSMKEAIEIVSIMKDTAGAVSDLKDTTEIILDMKDTAEVACDLKTITETVLDMEDVISSTESLKCVISSTEDLKNVVSSTEDLKNVVSSVEDLKNVVSSAEELKDVVSYTEDLKDVISSVEDLKDVTVVAEKIETSVIENRSSDSAISSTVCEIVGKVSEEMDSEFEVIKAMDNLLSNVQVPCKSVSSLQVSTDSASTVNEKCVPLFEISSNSSTVMTENKSMKCDNSMSNNFDYQLPELPDEMDEQMLSAESDSSNSDNDMDSGDEMDVDGTYVFDQDSNLSDDSILSEWSLDSAASVCSFSTDSDMSVDSAASIQGEQETNNLIYSHQNNVTTTVEIASEFSPKAADLTFKGKICSSSENLSIENNLGDLTIALDTTKPSENSNEEVTVQESNLNVTNTAIVPDSRDNIFPVDESFFEIIAKTLNSCISTVEHMSLISESPVEISHQVGPETVISRDAVPIVSSNESDDLIHTTNVESEMPCDNDNTCTIETSEILIDSNTETCTKNTGVIDTDVESLRESLSDHYNNSVLPETVECISKSNEISVIDIVNSEQNVIHKNSRSLEIGSCVVDKKRTPQNFSCYEDVICQYGIVFKDMNTAIFDKIEHENFKEMDEHSVSRYHLASIKTVSWNPNHGSHHWLLSAGQSGIARLSYISDFLQHTSSERKTK